MAIFDFNSAELQKLEDFAPRNLVGNLVGTEKDFRSALLEAGLLPEEPIIAADIQRCQVPGDKANQKSGWYVYYDDHMPAGAYGNWRTGESYDWCAKNEIEMSAQELTAYRYAMDRARSARESDRRRRAIEAAERAKRDWENATPVETHPYLELKGVGAFGLKVLHGKLLMPMFNMAGEIESLQRISSSGEKRYLFGGEKQGNFYRIEGQNKIAICEGFATGASVHMATGWTTVIAFDAGNLLAVAENWRKANPCADIIICGDDDVWTINPVKNPGRTKAEEAAKAISAKTLFPTFSNLENKPKDWNDLHQREGLEALKSQLLGESKYRVNIKDWSLKAFAGEAPKREWLVEDIMPMASVFILAAMGDAGKGLLTLDLALKVAGKEKLSTSAYNLNAPLTAFGNKITKQGPVVIFSAEDDHGELHRRIENIGPGKASNIYVVPLPNAGGPMPLVVPGKNGPEVTPAWHEIKEQLIALRPVLINLDPLASFVMADINADPAVGAFTMGILSSLAQETGAAVMVAHHLAKTAGNIASPEDARRLVRGTSAIVDNSRAVYVLWGTEEKESRAICKVIETKWMRNKVFKGCLVKSNGPGDREIKTYVRNDFGLLEVRTAAITAAVQENKPALLNLLEESIAKAASLGQPYCLTGENGLFTRKHELPVGLKELSKRGLESVATELLEVKRIHRCVVKGSTLKKYLDVPEGDFASGKGEIVTGAVDAVKWA